MSMFIAGNRFAVYLIIGVLTGLLHTAAAAIELGRNLSGELCRAQETSKQGSARRYAVYCSSGSGTPAAVVDWFGRDSTALPALLNDSPWAKQRDRDHACQAGKQARLAAGLDTLLKRCTAMDGGWPTVSFVARKSNQLFAASGLVTTLPNLEILLLELASEDTGSARQGSLQNLVKHFEQQLGVPLGVLSAEDIATFNKLREIGNTFNGLGNFQSAKSAWQRALDIQEKLVGAGTAPTGDTLAHLALNISNGGDFALAEQIFGRAEPLVKKSTNPDHFPRFLVYSAFHLELLGQPDEALELVAESIKIRRQRGDSIDAIAHSQYADANIAFRLDRLDRARASANDAVENFRDAYGGYHWWTAESLSLMADVEAKRGNFSAALRHSADAVSIREQILGRSTPLAQSYAQQAAISRAMGQDTDALINYRSMAEVLLSDARVRRDADGDDIINYILTLLDRAARVTADKADLTNEAFLASQIIEGSTAAQAINQMAARLISDNPALSKSIRSRQEAYERLDALGRRVGEILAKKKSAARDKELTAVKAEQRQASEMLNAINGEINGRFPGFAALTAAQPLSVEALSGLLDADEAIFRIYSSANTTVIFLVHQGRIKANALSLPAAALAQVVTQLRDGVDLVNGSGEFNPALAYKLYEVLFKPFENDLAGVSHLIYVPSGALLSVPPGILLTAPAGNAPFEKMAWLAAKYDISVMPSVNAFRRLRTAPLPAIADRGFIGFGNPVFQGDANNNAALTELSEGCRDAGQENAELIKELEPLPETVDELQAIAKSLAGFGSGKLVTGRDATEQTVRSAGMERYRVIAFATHGLLPQDLPCDAEPGLALTPPAKVADREDGLLDASEIATLSLNADLVLLSACNTAGPDGRLGGESLSGLARAFLYAGSRAVYASHWAVPSESTVSLTTGIFDRLAGNQNIAPVAAARQSQVALIADPDTSHPLFWGAFTYVGDGRRWGDIAVAKPAQATAPPKKKQPVKRQQPANASNSDL